MALTIPCNAARVRSVAATLASAAALVLSGCAPTGGEAPSAAGVGADAAPGEPGVVPSDVEGGVEGWMDEAKSTIRDQIPGYDLTAPVLDVRLPKKLDEVSGLVALDGGGLASVQDERGTIYLVEPMTGEVTDKVKFAGKGDFEAVTRVGRRWFVLRSDGVVFDLTEVDEGKGKEGLSLKELGRQRLDLPHGEFEGLAYDPLAGRLLLAPKDRLGKESNAEKKAADEQVPIYALELQSGSAPRLLRDEPALVLDRKKLIRTASEHGLPLPKKRSGKGKEKAELRLRISEIAVHPITGEIFVLSGPDRALLVLDRSGRLVGSAVFPKSLLPQPEGAAFGKDGTLYLSSEGAGGRARLMGFSPRD